MSKNSNDPQNNLLNNAQIGYYDENGNFIPDDHYAPNNDLTPAGYYDTNGFFIITGY